MFHLLEGLMYHTIIRIFGGSLGAWGSSTLDIQSERVEFRKLHIIICTFQCRMVREPLRTRVFHNPSEEASRFLPIPDTPVCAGQQWSHPS